MRIGAQYHGNLNCEFTVWAPGANRMELKLVSSPERIIPMAKDAKGYWNTTADGVTPGTAYLYRIDDEKERPDPASSFQPDGVHAPSRVFDHDAFPWEDACWRGIPLVLVFSPVQHRLGT